MGFNQIDAFETTPNFSYSSRGYAKRMLPCLAVEHWERILQACGFERLAMEGALCQRFQICVPSVSGL